MENQQKINILVRLLKEGHISSEEFQTLYPEKVEQVFIPHNRTAEDLNDLPYDFMHLVNPDWLPSYAEPGTGDWHTLPWLVRPDGTVTRTSDK